MMHEQAAWSINLGRWGGVRFHLHAFFLVFALFTLYLSWTAGRHQPGDSFVWVGIFSIIILLISVLLHEMAHCQAALSSGAHVSRIVIGPLGGMEPVQLPQNPHREFVMLLAGPLANLFVCLCCAPVLMLSEESVAALLHPLRPGGVIEGSLYIVALKLTFWINWLLMLVNLVPAFPMDGGRALRAGIVAIWPEFGQRNALLVVATLAKLSAIGLLVVAWLMRNSDPAGLVPTWFALVLMAVFLYFGARHETVSHMDEEGEETLFGYDFSQGYTSLEQTGESTRTVHPEQSPFVRWVKNRRAIKQRRQEEIEAEEDRRMDEILSRLHEAGLNGLSTEDRELLDRVSARYRSRHDDL